VIGRLQSIVVLSLLVSSCGYHSMVGVAVVEVRPIRLETPNPELASCLTSELRRGFGTRSSAPSGQATFRLEGTLVGETETPTMLIRQGDRLVALEEEVEIALRVRVIGPEGLIFAPLIYRVDASALLSEMTSCALQSIHIASEQACFELARRLIDDVLELISSRSADEEDHGPKEIECHSRIQ